MDQYSQIFIQSTHKHVEHRCVQLLGPKDELLYVISARATQL